MTLSGIRRPLRLAIAMVLALALGYPLHKVYEQSLSLMGVSVTALALYRSVKLRYWFMLGLFNGIAAIIGRNSGLYIAIAALAALATTGWLMGKISAIRATVAYGSGVLLGYLPMILWFLCDSRFRHAMIESILFTPNWQLPLPIPFPWTVKQSLSSIPAIQATAVSWLSVIVFALYVFYGMKCLHSVAKRQEVTTLAALELAALFVGVPYLHQAFDRADFGHIAQGIMPLFLLASTRINAPTSLADPILSSALLIISMIAWLPSEPRSRTLLLQHVDSNATRLFTMDGRLYVIDSRAASLLAAAYEAKNVCDIKDGQLVSMPHSPGILAYLHLRSPFWEMYYLYPRDAAFQKREIDQLESVQAKVALVDWNTAMDGRDDLRFQALNPILADYLKKHFHVPKRTPDLPTGVELMVRNCPAWEAASKR